MKKLFYYSLWCILLGLFMVLVFLQIKAMGAEKGMEVIIDRFEGDFAVVELPNKTMVNMPLKLLGPGTSEGDVVEIKVLGAETLARKNKANRLLNEVFEK